MINQDLTEQECILIVNSLQLMAERLEKKAKTGDSKIDNKLKQTAFVCRKLIAKFENR